MSNQSYEQVKRSVSIMIDTLNVSTEWSLMYEAMSSAMARSLSEEKEGTDSSVYRAMASSLVK